VLADNGIVLSKVEKNHLLAEKYGKHMLEEPVVSEASSISIEMNLELLWHVLEKKEELVLEILRNGEPLKGQVELQITIRGIMPLTALAFFVDVGDIRRFKTLRKMNTYLGLVPRLRLSGDKSWSGHINRASRKLTRTILTQSLIHVTDASLCFRNYYDEMKIRRGAGRSRIALIRKFCGIMRRMLLDEKPFKYAEVTLCTRKQKQYERTLNQIGEDRERKSAWRLS
jgi:transposase